MALVETVSVGSFVFGNLRSIFGGFNRKRPAQQRSEAIRRAEAPARTEALARLSAAGVTSFRTSFTGTRFNDLAPGAPTAPSSENLPPVSGSGGVPAGIFNIRQILERLPSIGLPEFDIIRNLPVPGGRPMGRPSSPRTRRARDVEQRRARERASMRRQRTRRRRERERLEQLSRLGKRIPEPRDFPLPDEIAKPTTAPPRPEIEPLGLPEPVPATVPAPAPVSVPAPQGPPRPQIGNPPSRAPRTAPGAAPGASAALGAAFLAGALAQPGTAPQFRPGRAPRVRTQPAPAGSPISGTQLGFTSQQAEQLGRQQKRERDRCEKRRRGERRRKCYRGFYEEYPTRTEFTRWVEVDCVTRKRKDKGEKISERAGKTGRVLKKAKRATRRIPRGVIPIG